MPQNLIYSTDIHPRKSQHRTIVFLNIIPRMFIINFVARNHSFALYVIVIERKYLSIEIYLYKCILFVVESAERAAYESAAGATGLSLLRREKRNVDRAIFEFPLAVGISFVIFVLFSSVTTCRLTGISEIPCVVESVVML